MIDDGPEHSAGCSDGATDSALTEKHLESKLKWKAEILAVLVGERATQIIRAGGAAPDYLRTLIRPGPNFNASRCILIEALTEILREVPLSFLSSSGLNHLLDLITDLRPKNAFQALASYLKSGIKAEPQFVPFGGSVNLDLHEKILETLEMDFDVPPLSADDPAFLTYVEILRQQMLDPQCRAYSASQLIKLEVLQTDSSEFKNLIAHDLHCAGKILHNLIMFGGSGYGFSDITAVFYAGLEYGTEGLSILSAALNRSGSRLELPEFRRIGEEDVIPNLTLFNGVKIPINLSEDQMFLVYRHHYEVSMDADLKSLLSTDEIEISKREAMLTRLFNKACRFGSTDLRFLTFFEEQVKANGGELVTDLDDDRVYVEIRQTVIQVQLGEIQSESLQTFLNYRRESLDVPSRQQDIQETIQETIDRAERYFVATI